MPVVIRELHIKVNVEEEQPDSPQGTAPAGRESRDAIISECVEKVIEIMKQEKLR